MACVYRMPDNKCEKCSHEDYADYCGFDDTSDCVWYKPSNADRFRAMPDEELADWLIMNGDGSDYETWLKWLKQECNE